MKIGQKVIVPVPDKKSGKPIQKVGRVVVVRGNVIIVDVDGDKRAYHIDKIKPL